MFENIIVFFATANDSQSAVTVDHVIDCKSAISDRTQCRYLATVADDTTEPFLLCGRPLGPLHHTATLQWPPVRSLVTS